MKYVLNKFAPIICAECGCFVPMDGNYQMCNKTKKRIYNSKPDRCPFPTWIEKSDCEQMEVDF